jgi:hypothetical protein
MAEESGFGSRQGEEIFLLFTGSQLALGPTLLPIQHIINTVSIITLQNPRADQTQALTASIFLFHYN